MFPKVIGYNQAFVVTRRESKVHRHRYGRSERTNDDGRAAGRPSDHEGGERVEQEAPRRGHQPPESTNPAKFDRNFRGRPQCPLSVARFCLLKVQVYALEFIALNPSSYDSYLQRKSRNEGDPSVDFATFPSAFGIGPPVSNFTSCLYGRKLPSLVGSLHRSLPTASTRSRDLRA